MKKGLLLIAAIIFIAFNTNAQVNENFSSVTADENINLTGWTNFAEAGTRVFIGKYYSDQDNYYAQMSAYNSDEVSNIVWLISPNVVANGSSSLNFSSKAAYLNADVFSLWISTDFSGDVAAANWTELSFTEPTAPDDGYGDWTESGNIDLSSYDGQTINIAFKYSGGDPGATTTWQIDDVVITGTTNVNNISSSAKLFPNPATSVLNIQSEVNISNITVSNVIGQRVLNVNSINTDNYKLELNTLTNGVYLININNVDGTSAVAKFVKK